MKISQYDKLVKEVGLNLMIYKELHVSSAEFSNKLYEFRKKYGKEVVEEALEILKTDD